MKPTISDSLDYVLVTVKLEQLVTMAYSEPHRKYHNADHIVSMLQRAHQLKLYHQINPKEMRLLEFAIMFHDIVYIPGSTSNERISAHIAAACLRDEEGVEGVHATILATHDHTNPNNESLPLWGRLLLDLDLYNLATEEYEANSELIQQEFLPFCENLEAYQQGRLAWINKMLASERMYWLHTELEHPARNNLMTMKQRIEAQIGE